ncbi:hypothetical protein GCM10027590_64270 [Nocardiopsis nanhaiensis]
MPPGSGHSGPDTTAAFASQPAPPPTEGATDKPERRSRKPLMVGMAILAVVFMLIGGGGTYLVIDRVVPALSDSDEPVEAADAATENAPEPTEEPEPSPTPTPTESDEPEDDPSADPTEDPSEDPTGEGERLLTQLDPVETNYGIWEPDRAELNGEVHNRVLLAADSCAGACDTAWAEYNLSRSWDTFTATVGLDDNSRSDESVTFTVYVEGDAVVTETLGLGETIEVQADVSDVLRMRLDVELSGPEVFPVWSEPTLTAD